MKILSLDIGSHSVKAELVDVTFGRVELSEYYTQPVPPEPEKELGAEQAAIGPSEPTIPLASQTGTPGSAGARSAETPEAPKTPARKLLTSGQLEAIRAVLSSLKTGHDRVIVNFPKGWVTTRVFTFPTRDRKTIQSSLAFELDDEIPFGMNDIVYDFAVLDYNGTTSTVFTAVALKADLTELVSELQMLGLDPDHITVECWAMSHLLTKAIPKEYEGRPVCVVNIGHRQTYIHMQVGNGPILTHVSTCAGDDVTRAIASAYSLPYDQAEQAKTDGAFLLTQLHLTGGPGADQITEDQRHFSKVIGEALTPMVREIKQTLMSYKSQHKLTPRAIFITGGSSLIMNMPLYLEEQLKIPVFPLKYMSRVVGPTLQLSDASEALFSTATGLAVSVVKIDRNFSINLRKDEFIKRGGIGALNVAAYKRPLKIVAAAITFILINLIAQGALLNRQLSAQEDQLERSMKSVLGALSPSQISTYRNSPSTLKEAVKKEFAKYKQNQAATPKQSVSAFDILNKVSAAMPRDMTLDVSLFEVKQGKVRLHGIVDQLANSDRIAKALEDTSLVTEVVKEKAEEDPKTKKVRFQLSAKVAEAGNVKTR